MILSGMAILCCLVGALLLGRGLVRIPVAGHTSCTGCTFDLSGLVHATVCPECGTSLQEPGSRTVGTFRRRPALIVTGGVLLAVQLLMMSGVVGSARWYHYAPLWLIERQSRFDPESQQAHLAREEILSRAQSGTIPPDRLHEFVLLTLADARTSIPMQGELIPFLSLPTIPTKTLDAVRAWAFKQHADRSLPLSMSLADYLNTEFWSGRLDAKEMELHLRAAARPELVIGGPQTCAPGESLPLTLSWNWRGGTTEVVSSIDIPDISFNNDYPPEQFGLHTLVGSHVASLVPGTHEIRGTVTIQLTGRFFALYASQNAMLAAYPGGPQNIPPITIAFPMSAIYTVDPNLPIPSADPNRQAIMRSISVHFRNAPVNMGWGEEVPILFVTMAPQYSAEADLEWSDGKTSQPFGHAKIALQGKVYSLQFNTANGSYRGGGRGGDFDALALGESGPPEKRRILRVHFNKVELRPKGGSPSPIEPFDLEFAMPPAK